MTIIKTNLKTIVSLHQINKQSAKNFEQYLGIQLKAKEPKTIESFVSFLENLTNNSNNNLYVKTDSLYLDFTIPGINKEFDIIKITKDFILNIELKSGNKSTTEMCEQLIKNRFYLSKSGIDKQFYYIYNAETNKLYQLLDNNQLKDVSQDTKIINYLNTPNNDNKQVESLFEPSHYLVSPFNDTERFLNHDYLLTPSQQAKKSELKTSNQKTIILTGNAGTGKTLLLYDLASDYINNEKKVYIVHCGKLNAGHNLLINKGFNIIGINSLESLFKSEINDDVIIFVDEMQRLSKESVNKFINEINTKIFFFGDPKQTLSFKEYGLKLIADLSEKEDIQHITLKNKIRSNASLAEFIKGLMDKNYKTDTNHPIEKGNISIDFFHDDNDAKEFMAQLEKDQEFEVLVLPGSIAYSRDQYTQYNTFHNNAFTVIGQEFNNVATLIGSNLYYNSRGKLESSGTHYMTSQSLFQNITRTRKKLKLIIVNNIELMERALELLK